MPVMICGLDDVPAEDKPVLLDIDSDYFVGLLQRHPEITLEEQFVNFGNGLKRAGFSWDIATVAYSTNFNYTPLEYRFIGDALRDLLATPGLRLPPEAEPIFLLRSRADRESRAGRRAIAEKLLRTILAQRPEDPPAVYALAILRLGAGDLPQALLLAEKAARGDAAYAYGMVQIGRKLSGSDYNARASVVSQR